jgi:ABC-type sugar transport system substrate-binding protein
MSDARIDRRTLLRGGAAALLGTSAAGLLAACGGDGADEAGPQERAVARRSIAIDYASYYPPAADVRRLVEQRARARGARVTFSEDPSGVAAQLATLRRWSGPRGGFHAIVVAPFDAAALAPLVRDALAREIAVVSYLAPLQRQTAAIAVDPERCGRLLAADAAGWAQRALGGGDRRAQALVVRPPAAPTVPDPFAALAGRAERALLAELRRRDAHVVAVAATEATGRADAKAAVVRALQDYPDARLALCFDDTTAAGAAEALTDAVPEAERPRLYAGGIAVDGIATAASLDTLASGGVLRALVAPRVRDLADALVELPWALLHGRPPRDADVPARLLSAATPQLIATYRRDYASA